MKKAFTLIELLVVVLIIGILAAVAVPQYQKAVEKSKSAQALLLLKSVYQAYESYYLANNAYPTDFSQLDVNIPWTGSTKYTKAAWPTLSNKDWSLQLSTYGTFGLLMGRISGPYAGAGFGIWKVPTDGVPKNTIICIEGSAPNSVISPFSKPTGDYCSKIMGMNRIPLGHANQYFQ